MNLAAIFFISKSLWSTRWTDIVEIPVSSEIFLMVARWSAWMAFRILAVLAGVRTDLGQPGCGLSQQVASGSSWKQRNHMHTWVRERAWSPNAC